MKVIDSSRKVAASAGEYRKEKDYWLKKLSGEWVKGVFPYDHKETGAIGDRQETGTVKFHYTGELFSRLVNLSNNSGPRLHMILAAGLLVLLYKYTGSKDVTLGAPIYRQETEAEFINTILVLRSRLTSFMTFKELLLQVRETLVEAVKHQNYPLEALLEHLNLDIKTGENGFPLFDIAILLESIHEKKYLRHTRPNMLFTFTHTDQSLEGTLEHNALLYERVTVERVLSHLEQVFQNALVNVEAALGDIDILTKAEKKQLLFDFNDTTAGYPGDKTIHEFFAGQAARVPGNIAVLGPGDVGAGLRGRPDHETQYLDYRELNEKSNRLAQVLRQKGVTAESAVAVMMEPSIDRIVALMAVLKAGGAYLPIEPDLPEERVVYMLEDSGAAVFLSDSTVVKDMSFTSLQGLKAKPAIHLRVTASRPPINEFDRLPIPDRSIIDLRNYRNKIGMASVIDCMSLQTTRGCPYECLYCHKIWSKKHVHRSAENIFNEIEYYYKNGVGNFAFIDDSFNLNRDNCMRLFDLLIKNRLKVRLFFPNGVRGDIMTPDYIDRMVEAGTCGINLSLETASPRLQTLLKKNLDLDKFKKVMEYIAVKHPGVILEMATMHGFPSETREEAMMTLDFIKSIKWLHFPYIHILKIYPNTEMEQFALEQGISKRDIMISRDRAFHELPETLPFPKGFTRKYQANFMNEYFLNKERLQKVLPLQMKILSEAALVQKYNAYLPTDIASVRDIIDFAGLGDLEIPGGYGEKKKEKPSIFDRGMEIGITAPRARKILFLDLSQHFSSHAMLYRVVEQPLGMIYLATYLKKRFGDKIDSRIYKAGNDFDSFEELKILVEEYRPHLVGIRTLTFYKEFFHETVSLLRQWGIDVPIIAGGPYASSDYDTILADKNISLVVLGEGEYTLGELIEEMLNNDFQIPGPDVLRCIKGIAYADAFAPRDRLRQVILLDRIREKIARQKAQDPGPAANGHSLAYVMYTSGSTGRPKGVMVEHRQVNNCITWMQDKFRLTEKDTILQRTNLTFDPSVWEIFWPLSIGGSVRLIHRHQSKDAEFLLQLMGKEPGITMMYCTATLVNIMVSLLEAKPGKPTLKLPWLIIGAEPIGMDTIKTFYSYYQGRIVNTYGPTECTINNTYYDIEREDNRSIVPIGKPVFNNKIYILSPDLQLMPVHIPGEICIAGDSVSRGYINNRKRTDECFIVNPFGKGKLYRTGDMGRWLEDGSIEIMGRLDHQVKIRGYRVELGEIETLLRCHHAIDDSVVAAKSHKELQEKIRECKMCGIWSNYPGITISSDETCNLCKNLDKYKKLINRYFKTLDDLELKIREGNKNKKGKYDCLLVYACERVATYALYQLKEMGFNVLTVTYDSGHYEKESLDRIKEITSKIGVDHIFLTHARSEAIMKESLRIAKTMCKGCIHTSSALAGQYALENGIKFVIGETLSQGQIVENKLQRFLEMGVNDVEELDVEIAKLQKNTPLIDKRIFDIIGIEEVSDSSIYQKVEFIDFYRYCNVTHDEMIKFLDSRDPYWKGLETKAIYSTDCKICQVGNFNHLKQKGYHYTGSAKSWDKRLGLTTLKDLKEDLKIDLTAEEHGVFLTEIGYREEKTVESNRKFLCAYFVSEKDLSVSHLREFLSEKLPGYMIPTYFIRMEKLPLTPNGKIDRKALPNPDGYRPKLKENYVKPESDLEKVIANVWAEVLKVDMAGTGDNFFDLGGSSLDIILVGSKLKDELNMDIPVVTLFTYPTISSLAQNLSREEAEENFSKKKIKQVHSLNKSKSKMKKAIHMRKNK